MRNVLIAKLFVLLLLPALSQAQKLKYKEIFTLIEAKQYEKAEPFLRSYINENKSPEPSSFLFMGIICQEKTNKDDILKNVQGALNHIDSALLFYDKAYKTINDKEFKGSTKDYYAMYSKRDLRTGEFGVKLSDVQFDIEKRTAAMRERKDKIGLVKLYFSQAEDLYKRSNELFKVIQHAFPGEREFYLRTDDLVLKQLALLAARYDSSKRAFDLYKSSVGHLGKIGYNHSWNAREIKDFKRDGITLTDFYQDNLEVWDYKKFADQSVAVVNNELKPIRENLLKYDIEINKLREKLKEDSVSVKSDLTKLVASLLGEKLKKFDPDPLPMNVFALKVANLEYRSTLVEHIKGEKTNNVFDRLKQKEEEVKRLGKLDSVAAKLQSVNIDEEALNYKTFIAEAYTNTVILKSYVKAEKEYAEREKRIKERELANRRRALNWLVNGNDSIPLVLEPTNAKFKPLVVEAENYTAGIFFTDSVSGEGYFYTITGSRIPDVRVKFPIDKTVFREQRMRTTKALATTNEGNQIFFVLLYSENKVKDKYPVTVAKIYRSDGLSWSQNYTLDFTPEELQFTQETGELRVKGSDKTALLDKNGKLK
ncbi:MAG: hypothetical protein KF725_13035 [Cyclobacteriaceae bacterium]|nr:hypothetical protein [Cyclobacteriaceae bacterium]UYN85448.1 MAG: hypothetical protein KIT51_11180 [Cyclobacteriaceae bacterium]